MDPVRDPTVDSTTELLSNTWQIMFLLFPLRGKPLTSRNKHNNFQSRCAMTGHRNISYGFPVIRLPIYIPPHLLLVPAVISHPPLSNYPINTNTILYYITVYYIFQFFYKTSFTFFCSKYLITLCENTHSK